MSRQRLRRRLIGKLKWGQIHGWDWESDTDGCSRWILHYTKVFIKTRITCWNVSFSTIIALLSAFSLSIIILNGYNGIWIIPPSFLLKILLFRSCGEERGSQQFMEVFGSYPLCKVIGQLQENLKLADIQRDTYYYIGFSTVLSCTDEFYPEV